jgi:hypothetical protein
MSSFYLTQLKTFSLHHLPSQSANSFSEEFFLDIQFLSDDIHLMRNERKTFRTTPSAVVIWRTREIFSISMATFSGCCVKTDKTENVKGLRQDKWIMMWLGGCLCVQCASKSDGDRKSFCRFSVAWGILNFKEVFGEFKNIKGIFF